jgi:hypothetical protein
LVCNPAPEDGLIAVVAFPAFIPDTFLRPALFDILRVITVTSTSLNTSDVIVARLLLPVSVRLRMTADVGGVCQGSRRKIFPRCIGQK